MQEKVRFERHMNGRRKSRNRQVKVCEYLILEVSSLYIFKCCILLS